MLSLIQLSIFLSTLANLSLSANAKSVFITNNCPYTVWPVISNTNIGGGYTGPTGWEAPPGHFHSAEIPSIWNGRIWARRGCSFDANGQGKCIAADCAGRGLECGEQIMGDGNLAEMNLNDKGQGTDWYNLSNVLGFVVPMSIVPGDSNCETITCTTDMNPTCPDDRMKVKDGDETIGCLSACKANINGGDNSQNCCSGSFETHAACRPEMVDFYDFFKQSCPKVYAYPRDDATDLPNKVVYTCPSGVPWYRVTFC
ncbi:hypothetical protein JCM5353_001116 [Sporobolomyces roseus]